MAKKNRKAPRVPVMSPEEALKKLFSFRSLEQLLEERVLLDVAAVSKILHCSGQNVRWRCKTGRQAHVRYNGRFLFLPEQVKIDVHLVPTAVPAAAK